MRGFSKKTLLIPGHYIDKGDIKEKIGNLDFYLPSYLYLFNTPPPAFNYNELIIYHDLGIFPQMKDPANIRKGFYMKTLESEEKEKLGKIIEKYSPLN